MSVPGLTSLLKQSQITDHEEALRAANATIKTNKTDTEALRVKVVALLKLDRFEDAVRTVENGGEKLKDLVTLEYAYALYKSGKRQQAAEISQSTDSRGLQHVEAQARYVLEDFVRASELYKSLSQDAHDDNAADLRVNTLAVNAQLQWSNLGQHVQDQAMTRGDFEAHETVYNTACGSIARGELGQCEVLLNRARSLCENLQDLSDDEKASELLPITIQQIYVLARLGKLDEARKLSQSLDDTVASDAITRYLAKVNAQAIEINTANPYLLERQLSVDLDTFALSPPFNFQKAVMSRNQYALDLTTMKFSGTAASTQAKLGKESTATIDASTNTVSVVNAAAHAKNQTGKEGLKHILGVLQKRPNDVGLVLTVVQLYVLTNNVNSAIELLQKFLARLEPDAADVRYAPGLVGTVVSLYSTQGRREQARGELRKAAAHWRGRSEDLTPGIVHLLKAAGSSLVESQDPDDHVLAKQVFEQLHARDKYDKYAAAGLLAASTDSAGTIDQSALTTLEKLTAGIDAKHLEAAGVAQRATVQQTASRKRPAASEPAQSKTKKLRKSRLPKDYDPGKTPDPERWLPLRDRSSYRPKGKKGKARQAMLSQGAVAGDNDGSRPATPGSEVMKANTSGGNKKKKAKSRK